MQKLVFLICSTIILQTATIGQSVIQKTLLKNITSFETYSRHQITRLGLLRPDDYTRALYDQYGVIGNSFDKAGEIGKAPADPDGHINSHFPVTGFKQTICGPLNSYYIRGFCSGDSDDDVHFEIRPGSGSKTLIDEVNRTIQSENLSKYSGQTLPLVDYSNVNSIAAYNSDVETINLKIRALNVGRVAGTLLVYLRTLKSVVLSEIDVHEAYKSFIRKFDENVPKQEIDCACSYGPWIHDIGTGSLNPFASFHDYYEIHPAEQVWWTNQHNNMLNYHLYLFNDNSGRFDENSEFDTNNGSISFNGPWTPQKLDGTFALAFSYQLGQPTATFIIERIASKNPLPKNDGIKHFLIYRGDTIAEVIEPNDLDILEINFEKIGLDPVRLLGARPDSVITGFVVIRNSIGKETGVKKINSEKEGNILLRVNARNSILKSLNDWRSLQTIKVKLDKIDCRSMKADDDYGEIYGYVGVRATSTQVAPQGITIHPTDEKDIIWSRLDHEGIPVKKGDVIYDFGSKEFILDSSATLEIKSDLNEDNDNSTDNETMSDDGDDRLLEQGNVKSSIYVVKNISRNNPVHFTQVFYNKGKNTEIILYFTITNSGNRFQSGGIIDTR